MVIQTINIMWVKQCHKAPIVDLNWKWSIQSIQMVISGMFLLYYPHFSFLYNVVPPSYKLDDKPHEYHSYLRIINHSYWSYVAPNLVSYRTGASHCMVWIKNAKWWVSADGWFDIFWDTHYFGNLGRKYVLFLRGSLRFLKQIQRYHWDFSWVLGI